MSAGSLPAIIADDLTGAADTALPFALQGWPTLVLLTAEGPVPADHVVALSTGSRALPPAAAAGAVRAAVARLRPAGRRPLYKKIDSTMRGNVGAEVEAALAAGGFRAACLTPAFPAMGRTVVAGRLLVDGRPVDETAFRWDPITPVWTAAIGALLAQQTALPLRDLPLAVVRQPDRLIAHLQAARGIVIADSETDDDLAALARACLALPDLLPVGSAGLATQIARLWGPAPGGMAERRRVASRRPVLVVVGSAHPQAGLQVADLVQHGFPWALYTPDGRSADREERRLEAAALQGLARHPAFVLTTRPPTTAPVAKTGRDDPAWVIGRVAARVIVRYGPPNLGGVVVTGGDTALALCRALGAEAIAITAAVLPGFPAGWLRGGAADGLPIVTKAGGFGPPSALGLAVRFLQEAGAD